MAACVPSQNGLFLDPPQRHSVTRLRTSYSSPSAAISAIPPRSQSGPLQVCAGSSIRPIEGASSSSSAAPASLSHTTRRPDGQFWTCRMNVARTLGSSVRAAWLQTWPFGSQNRANAHKLSTSSRAREGPSNICAWSRYGARSATSVPSKPIFVWEPSQNGFLSECPHRHSANFGPAGRRSFSIQSSDDPSEPVAMICSESFTPPVTI